MSLLVIESVGLRAADGQLYKVNLYGPCELIIGSHKYVSERERGG